MIERDGNRARVTVPMTIANANALARSGGQLANGGDVVMDLGAVKELDSSALTVIFGWVRAAGGRKLTVVNVPSSLLSLAQLYGVSDLLPLA